MRRLITALLVLGMLAAFSATLKAEVQNVRLGGDIRTRMYYTKNLYSVDQEDDQDDFFFRQRTRVSAEADLTDQIWVVSTVEADGVWGQQVVKQDATGYTKERNEWDVNVAEAYIQLSEIVYSRWTAKLGRQYLNYGRGFLISSREWEYKFDCWRNILDFFPWTIDLFYSRLVESDRAAMGGGIVKAADDEDLFGLNLNYQADYWTLEGYVFGKRDQFGEDYGDAKQAPIAVGIRFDASPVEAFDIWGEFAYELGKYQSTTMAEDESMRAFGFDLGAVYVFDVAWQPAIALSYTYGSGDKGEDAANPDQKTFDPLFNYNYYGYAYSPKLSNIGILNAQLSVLPSEAVAFIIDFYYYTQSKDRAMPMGNEDMDNGGVSAKTNGEDKALGMELDAILEYDYTEDVSLQLVGAWFKPGKAYDLPTNDEDPDDVVEIRAQVLASF
ncbi:MAG: alginate export family protein [Candidatus Euphemobacter frigidus]|nr:alginate export family protein [Candidatus Euphemobacter frigidus]MDP8276286.1 alginate export family protein [Candidatus Euphemobacter frigidus]